MSQGTESLEVQLLNHYPPECSVDGTPCTRIARHLATLLRNVEVGKASVESATVMAQEDTERILRGCAHFDPNLVSYDAESDCQYAGDIF